MQLTLKTKSTNIDKVALHIHHMMTLTNFIHFQRFQKKKPVLLKWEDVLLISRIFDPHCWIYVNIPYTVPSDVSTVFKALFSSVHFTSAE